MTQKWEGKQKQNENSGHYVIASSQPPKCRPLEPHMLVPIPVLKKTVCQTLYGKFNFFFLEPVPKTVQKKYLWMLLILSYFASSYPSSGEPLRILFQRGQICPTKKINYIFAAWTKKKFRWTQKLTPIGSKISSGHSMDCTGPKK